MPVATIWKRLIVLMASMFAANICGIYSVLFAVAGPGDPECMATQHSVRGVFRPVRGRRI